MTYEHVKVLKLALLPSKLIFYYISNLEMNEKEKEKEKCSRKAFRETSKFDQVNIHLCHI